MQIKNESDANVDLPTLGLRVAPGETVEVTGDDAKALLTVPGFKRVDAPKARSNDTEES